MLESGIYVVATPIGNLADISLRALEVLKSVDVIAAEDTRHSRKLADHFGIDTPMMACHDHNEGTAVDSIIERLKGGHAVALISDAGTPLISDPGYRIVDAALSAEISVPLKSVPCRYDDRL